MVLGDHRWNRLAIHPFDKHRGNGLPPWCLAWHCGAMLIALILVDPVHSRAQLPEPAATFAHATQAMQEGHLDEADAGFAAVLKQSPAFAEAHFNLGLVRQEQGRYEDAIASFHKALALKPHLRGASLFLGISEFRVNRLEAASAAIKKETISHPRDANAWMWLGVVHLAQDEVVDQPLVRSDDLCERRFVTAPCTDDQRDVELHDHRASVPCRAPQSPDTNASFHVGEVTRSRR